ncbi:MAG TPA: porin, partial [Polyangiaceae bacterium]|nr:porin [Polyangiaceae bacterium]
MKTLAYSITASVLLLAGSPALAQLAPADPAPAPAPGPTPLAPVPAAQPLDAPLPAAAPEPQPAWAAPAPAQPVAPVSTAVEPEGEEELAPDRVTVGKNGGFWQPGLLLQAWGMVRHLDNDDADVPDTQTWFRIRRAELKMKGEIVPDLVAYQVMIDPAKTIFRSATVPVTPRTEGDPSPGNVSVRQPGNDASILQDVYITFLSDYADVSIGEFKIPVSLEGYGSSSRLILPERALVSTTFG